MNLNSSNEENERATDSQARAVRLLPVQAPERPGEGRESVAALSAQLAAARSDGAQLVDLLAEAYAIHARKSVDAEQRREELGVALEHIERLKSEAAELRSTVHELKKQHGTLTSDVGSLTTDLANALAARKAADAAADKHAHLLAAERTNAAEAQRRAAKFQIGLSRARRALSLSRRAAEDRERGYEARIAGLMSEIAELCSQAAARADAFHAKEAALKQRIASSERSEIELKHEIERLRAAENDARGEVQALMQRFITFVNDASDERRAEAQLLSELIDEAQKGFAWRIKRFLRNPWRK